MSHRTPADRDFAPRYHTIEQALRARIGELQPHDPLPSESRICEEFGVSRMTARAAMARLVADGLVYRAPGSGTFVAVPPTNRRADSLIRFSDDMRRQGRTPSSRIVEAGIRTATRDVASRLRLGRSTTVVLVRRVRLADGIPVVLETARFPGMLSALLDADLATGSLHEALVRLGRVPSLGHATITATTATSEDAQLLEVEPPAALLVERRLILDQHARPLELTESRYVGGRYGLDVTFDVEPPA